MCCVDVAPLSAKTDAISGVNAVFGERAFPPGVMDMDYIQLIAPTATGIPVLRAWMCGFGASNTKMVMGHGIQDLVRQKTMIPRHHTVVIPRSGTMVQFMALAEVGAMCFLVPADEGGAAYAAMVASQRFASRLPTRSPSSSIFLLPPMSFSDAEFLYVLGLFSSFILFSCATKDQEWFGNPHVIALNAVWCQGRALSFAYNTNYYIIKGVFAFGCTRGR